MTQAPIVIARVLARLVPDKAMKASMAKPAAIAANQAPMVPCLFREAVVCRLACSAGTSSRAPVARRGSQFMAVHGRRRRPMMTPIRAITAMTPVQNQESAKIVSAESGPGARWMVVLLIPVR